MSKQAVWTLGGCGMRGMTRIGALLALSCAAAVAQAQTPAGATAPATGKSDDTSLTWKGITLYGIVDIGVQYDTHSAPFSDYFPATSGSLLQKNGYDSPTGLTSNNLSQSRIGLSGNEHLFGDWAAVFRLETFFNPSSGDLSDALKSVTLNNGKPLTSQNVGVDSSVAGQLFAGAAYAGLASATIGTFTFGRNVTLVADGISKYDPMGAAQAFSVIGYSGTAAGGGDTEDRRLDQSIKYVAKYGPIHLGALYEFGSYSGSTDTGYQVQLGGEFAGFSADAYYFKKYDAISVGPLSVAQAQEVVNNCNIDATTVPAPKQVRCYSMSNSVAGTVSDNKTYMITALYNFGEFLPLKLYAGYEHIEFDNPTDPLPVGTTIIGGYELAVVNNAAYNNEKKLKVYWAGVKWNPTKRLELTAAYYGYKQDAYGTGANAGCDTSKSGTCSGNLDAVSGLIDYTLTRRFDVYFGVFWNQVKDGIANGYLPDAHNNVATTLGTRFKF
ncbi:MAG TPA: porin [Steroidobacteraceae bacterium]|nr:porin [Steroidobacteraceae bacterium]